MTEADAADDGDRDRHRHRDEQVVDVPDEAVAVERDAGVVERSDRMEYGD